ncbi:MAG: pilus assembly protein PilM [Phycisphaerales bacterium]|nr:MAG: pilus assembly protein PilM [Phycisphaerales bacterium]
MLAKLGQSAERWSRSLIGGTLPIGLDLGTHALRAVQLESECVGTEDRPRYRLRAAVRARRDESADLENEGPTATALRPGLRQLFGRGGFKGRNVVVGLDPPELVATAVNLPLNGKSLDDPQIRSALSFELARHITCEPAEAEIRAWSLPKGAGMAPTVMGVAVPRKLVTDLHDLVASAGYSCRRIDAGACALARCCTVFCQPPSDTIWGVLDIGQSTSRLVVVVDGVPVLQRELPTGGRIFTFRVAESVKLAPTAAERLKRDYGIVGGYPRSPNAMSAAEHGDEPSGLQRQSPEPDQPADEVQVPRLVFSAVRRSLTNLALEVEKSMAYAMHLHGDLPVSNLYLAGGGAGLKGLADLLSQEIGIDVKLADPLAGLSFEGPLPGGDPSCAWTRAIGLALLGRVS